MTHYNLKRNIILFLVWSCVFSFGQESTHPDSTQQPLQTESAELTTANEDSAVSELIIEETFSDSSALVQNENPILLTQIKQFVSGIFSSKKDSLLLDTIVDSLRSDSINTENTELTSIEDVTPTRSNAIRLNKRTEEDLAKAKKYIQTHKKQVFGSLGVAVPVLYYYATKEEPVFVEGIGFPPDWPE